jgi:hydrogenase nickel incorporation protein HypB
MKAGDAKMSRKIRMEKKVLSENDCLAEKIRADLVRHKVVALNLVSSPGSGKTSLLEKTLGSLNNDLRVAVIAGDVQTENDAMRLAKAGGQIVRAIVTGGACHLDARMVENALKEIKLEDIDILFIENVGNLVCPSAFDLGEDMKVVMMSTTEGDDKPMKYPAMFRRSSAMVLNKTDLLGFSDFDAGKAEKNALAINAGLRLFRMSCKTGEGLVDWMTWLAGLVRIKRNGLDL